MNRTKLKIFIFFIFTLTCLTAFSFVNDQEFYFEDVSSSEIEQTKQSIASQKAYENKLDDLKAAETAKAKYQEYRQEQERMARAMLGAAAGMQSTAMGLQQQSSNYQSMQLNQQLEQMARQIHQHSEKAINQYNSRNILQKDQVDYNLDNNPIIKYAQQMSSMSHPPNTNSNKNWWIMVEFSEAGTGVNQASKFYLIQSDSVPQGKVDIPGQTITGVFGGPYTHQEAQSKIKLPMISAKLFNVNNEKDIEKVKRGIQELIVNDR